jgi:NAD(P)H-hydrate repair Nnr-like enzyme with NAD(P)H-hydrate epimerase domain
VDERAFRTSTDRPVTAVTADGMREVDEVAVEEFGISLLQLMENAGRTLPAMDVPVDHGTDAVVDESAERVVDALVGYRLEGPLRGTAADLVERVNGLDATVLSLDVSSGVNATSGERAGPSSPTA